MTVFYADNFRGFRNQFISLSDVNFLVGENSSGKSSVVALIALLSNAKFWYTFEFNDEGIDLGGFEDILSYKRSSRFVTVGFLSTGQHNRIRRYMQLLRFKNDEGLPVLYEQHVLENNWLLSLRFEHRATKYVLSPIEQCDECHEALSKCLALLRHVDYAKGQTLKAATDAAHGIQYLAVINELNKKEKDRFSSIIPTSFVMTNNMTLVAPIRAKPRSFYSGNKLVYDTEGGHAPFLIKEILSESKKKDVDRETIQQLQSLSSFGKGSGLFDKLDVEAYGKTSNSPFEIDVIKDQMRYRINNVGYGVSQILPVLM